MYLIDKHNVHVNIKETKIHLNITVEYDVYFLSSIYNNNTIKLFTLRQISLTYFESFLVHLQGPTRLVNLIKGDYLCSCYLVVFYLHKIYNTLCQRNRMYPNMKLNYSTSHSTVREYIQLYTK